MYRDAIDARNECGRGRAPKAGGKAVAITMTSTAASVSDGFDDENTSEKAPFASANTTQHTASSGRRSVSSIAATCVEINQCVGWRGTGIATPSSRRRVDGVNAP